MAWSFWDTDTDTWKVSFKDSLKDKLVTYNDAEGSSLHVDYDTLDPEAAEIDKQSKYRQACLTWNALDTSNKQRIHMGAESRSSDSLGDSPSGMDTQTSNSP